MAGDSIFGKNGYWKLRKVTKIVAILYDSAESYFKKCTEFDFGNSSAPDPTGAAHSAPPDPLAKIKGSYF